MSEVKVDEYIISTLDVLRLLPPLPDGRPQAEADVDLGNWTGLHGALAVKEADGADLAGLRANFVYTGQLINRERANKNRENIIKGLLGKQTTLRRKIDRIELELDSNEDDD